MAAGAPVHPAHLPYDGAVAHDDLSPVHEAASGAVGRLDRPVGDDWTGLVGADLPRPEVSDWVVRRDCGAVVVFTGTARDHSEGRPGVELLTYEAYESEALRRLDDVAAEIRRRWTVGRVALLHRVGEVPIGEVAVVVAVSAPHRDEAFAAARFGIDAVKGSVPIWKRERWRGGDDWGLGSMDVTAVADVVDVAGAECVVAGRDVPA